MTPNIHVSVSFCISNDRHYVTMAVDDDVYCMCKIMKTDNQLSTLACMDMICKMDLTEFFGIVVAFVVVVVVVVSLSLSPFLGYTLCTDLFG